MPDAPYIRSFGPVLPGSPTNDQPLNWRTLRSAVRRRRGLVGALVLVGLFGAGAVAVLSPPMPSARTLVVLPATGTTSTGAPARDMATEVIIATSTPVLAAAGASVSPPIGPTTLKHQVAVTALSEDVLQVQVSDQSARQAKILANAVATDYIGYLARTSSDSTTGVLAQLQQENAQLTKQILDLQDQINIVSARLAAEKASSPAGQRDASLLGSLRSEQEEVSLQLNNVSSQIVTAQLSNSANANATQILQKAALVPTSRMRVLELAAAGAVLGLLMGCLVAVVRSRHDRRLRLRDEIAGAIGVPVVASLDAWRCTSAKDWRKLVESYEPSPVDVWNVRRALQRVAPGGVDRRQEVTIVAFAGDVAALAAGAQLARAAANVGLNVELEIGHHPSLALLRTACSLHTSPGPGGGLLTYEAAHANPEFSGVHLTVSVVAVEPGSPELGAMSTTSFLAVSSGFATADGLARVALAASDAGSPMVAIIVVNPEPADSTTGAVAVQVARARPLTRRAAQRLGSDFTVGQSR